MTYRFECPRGHRLEAEETQAGKASRCPACGESLIVPGPDGSLVSEEQTLAEEAAEASGEAVESLTVPCPKGHLLHALRWQLDRPVVCPVCETLFELREKDSLEARRRLTIEREARQKRIERQWLQLGIAGALLLGVIVGGLIIWANA
jgi:uncharacterized Zn finger protein (UPF0148 family)